MAVPAALAAIYASKWFLPALLTGGMLGSTALTERGRAKEREMTEEQLRVQKLLQEAAIKASKEETEVSRKKTEKYIKEIAKLKTAEATRVREDAMMQAFLQKQEMNMGMMMQALSGMTARPSGTPSTGGMLGVMRSSY